MSAQVEETTIVEEIVVAETEHQARDFKPDDFLTLWIRSQLDLPEDWEQENTKVSWETIESAWNGLSEEKRAEKADFWAFLERNRASRQKRYEILREALERHGLKVRSDSKLCRDFVFKNHGDKREIVRKMHVMKACHDNGANEKFKEYLEDLKTKNPSAVSPDKYVPLRDMFFDRFYQDYILENPDKAFRWVPHPALEEARANGTVRPPRMNSSFRGGAPRGRGGQRGGRFAMGPREDGGFRGGATRGRGGQRGRGAPRGRF